MRQFAHHFGRVLKLNCKFLSDVRGVTSIVFALAIVGVLCASGVALDFVRFNRAKVMMQTAGDSAVLDAVQLLSNPNVSDSLVLQRINAYLADNGITPSQLTGFTYAIDRNNLTVTTRLSEVVSPTFGASIGYKQFGFSTVSTAKLLRVKTPTCIIALNNSMNSAILASGGSSVNAVGCGAQDNSNSNSAALFSGGSTMSTASNCIVGSVSGLAYVTPSPQPGCKPVADPFSGIAQPSVGACDYNSLSLSKASTLSPGVYCGGLTLSGKLTYTFNPGLYIIKNGVFTSSGGGTMNGTGGVSFYLTGTSAGINWSGGGNYNFVAMSTGPMAGFVAYLDPSSTPASKSTVSGGGNTIYQGVFYFGRQQLLLSGGSTAATPSPFTAYVADNIQFTGGSMLNINYDASLNTVPVPAGLFIGTKGTILTN